MSTVAAPVPAPAAAVVAAAAVALEEPQLAVDPQVTDDPGQLLGHVLAELENAGHKMLASTLAGGSVTLEGNELKITISQPVSVIDLMMGSEPRRVANAAASATLGRAVKVSVVSGVPAAGNGAAAVVRPRNGASARSRAAEDPVVQRMREKFGAEIRTVIDHREKN
jgi:DNA polymerase-3 subunit gamma/tau